MKKKFPEKPTEDTLKAELDYSDRLVEVIEKQPKLSLSLKSKNH
ncbi:hypothetical protein [Thalassobacillus cyri]|nr:hypothetical protein [Thalassobacillus cyri]